ncbi:25065_t:CDS:1, partial [Cetraspora pellucida]
MKRRKKIKKVLKFQLSKFKLTNRSLHLPINADTGTVALTNYDT